MTNFAPETQSKARQSNGVLCFLLVLAPLVGCIYLLRHYLVDTPFSDDWTFIEDWIKLKSGTLSFGQLFTAHMEHRVTVPRLLALSAHFVGGGDLRWQNALTIFILIGTGWNLIQLLSKTTGKNPSDLWAPLSLMSAMLFCAVQWQGLLWPILFEAYIPVFMLTVVLRLWMGSAPPWIALSLSAICALIGMWSFGNGPLTLVLVPALIWTSREQLVSTKKRWRLSIGWSVFALGSVGLYFLNFENAAPHQFAYGQGEETTVSHSASMFLQKLPLAPQWITAVLGSHLSRGLHLDNLQLAIVVGSVSTLLFCAMFAVLCRERRDAAFVRNIVPWMALGAFSIGTALFISIGRIWVSRTAVVAISLRYVSHAVPLTLAIIALTTLLVYRYEKRFPWMIKGASAASAALAVLIMTQWSYGARNMELWQQSRLQGKALLLFANVLPDTGPLGPISGDGAYTKRLALEMEHLGIMHPLLLKDLLLKRFKISAKNLPPERAGFLGLEIKPNGQMQASGYSELWNGRPADLVLFTAVIPNEPEQIIALGTLEGVPRYLYYATKRDREYEATPQLTPEWTSRWAGPLSIAAPIPKGATIRAWALDVERMQVHLIPDKRTASH